MDKEVHEITSKEFQQKRYEISKDILASVLTAEALEKGVDIKRRVNLIFNCILVANTLMGELGYHVAGAKTDEGSRMRNLKDILENKGSDE
jgi:hypothetical protein